MKSLKQFSLAQRKKFYLDIVKSWQKESVAEIAQRWGVKKMAVWGAVIRIRKQANIPLPRLISPILTEDFIEELRKAYQERNK